MPGSRATISAAQFAQQLKQKYPQFLSVPDDELVATFVSKNPRYSADYQGGLLVSVSFDPGTGSTLPDESNISAWATPTSFDAGTSDARGAKPILPAESAAQTVEPTYLGATVVVKAESIPARLMVGRYEVVDELGRGGMGIVYKAFDPGIGRTVALKLMSEQLARDSEFRERFLREARGAGSLQHANIVTVHELGEWQGAPFIAMEFLQGRSLEDILRNEKTMSIEKRLDIVAQVCRGLDYAHARGVVHRDIKPANVMVTNDGIAKVVDFGIARLADQKLTSTGNVLGTVSYMSPEQLQGRAVDGRSDVFAVGVVLYEVLTSVLPFAAEDTGAAITNILYRQPPKLSSFLENYPPELDEIIGKALAKDPADRFQTAGELADQIGHVQQELRRSQHAPTVIRTTPLNTGATEFRSPSAPGADQHFSMATLRSMDAAKQWWKVADPKSRRKAVTIAVPIALFVLGIFTPGGKFSDSAMGGSWVTSTTIVLPIAVLCALILSLHLWGHRWKSTPSNIQAFIGAGIFILVGFCLDRIALGMMWYVILNKIVLPVVLALLVTFVVANFKFGVELWKSGNGRERKFSAVGLLLLAGVFLVTFSWNLIDYSKNWESAPKSYFARGGEFEQKEHAAGRPTVYDKQSTPAPTPSYPTFDFVQSLAGDTSVAFSPNGNLIASGDWGGTLRIWDAASGQLMHTITGLFNIKFLSFSPDGRWIVAPMVDRKIGVWDVATATLARTVAGGGDCVAFDSTGKWLATTNGGNIVNIWDPATGKLLKTFDAQAGVFSMAFAPGNPMPPYDGTPNSPTVLATGGGDGAVRLWDGGNGKLLLTLTGHRGWVSSLAFTSRSLAALGYEDAELRVWSLPSGELVHIIGAASGIGNVAVLGEENWLAYGNTDGTVRFWNINTGTELRSLQAHTQKVNSVAISPDGRWLATASSDKTTKVWKLN